MKVEDILSFRHFLLMPPPYHEIRHIEDIEGEVWADVVGYEGIYKVSSLGRIKALAKHVQYRAGYTPASLPDKILKQLDTSQGYKCINLYKDKKPKKIATHIIVARAFISNTENKKEVNHVFYVRHINFSGNLEWATRQENVAHAMKYGLVKTKLSHSVIESIRAEKDLTPQDLSKKYNIGYSTIKRLLNGVRANYYSTTQNQEKVKVRHANSRFTHTQVAYIKELREENIILNDIATKMNCSVGTIINVLKGRISSYNT